VGRRGVKGSPQRRLAIPPRLWTGRAGRRAALRRSSRELGSRGLLHGLSHGGGLRRSGAEAAAAAAATLLFARGLGRSAPFTEIWKTHLRRSIRKGRRGAESAFLLYKDGAVKQARNNDRGKSLALGFCEIALAGGGVGRGQCEWIWWWASATDGTGGS